MLPAVYHFDPLDIQEEEADSPPAVEEGRNLAELVARHLRPFSVLLTSDTNFIQEAPRRVRDLLHLGSTMPKVGAEGPLGSVYAVSSTTANFFFPLSSMQAVIKLPKAIYPTLRMTFENRTGWQAICTSPSALITLDDPSTPPNSPRMEESATRAWKRRILRGNQLHRRLYDEVSMRRIEGVYLAEPLERQEAFESMVFAQPWYPSNLEYAINNTPCWVQEQFNYIGNRLLLKEGDIYRILHDMATTLDWLHQHGIVHRDVKASNIFIDLKVGKLIGLLGDCEWLKEGFGYDPEGFMHHYPVWDPCALFNISTPFADRYGVLVLLARLSAGIPFTRCAEIRDQAITNLLTGNGIVFATLNPLEDHLFSISYASALTLICILIDEGVEPDAIYLAERAKAENRELTDTQLCLKVLEEEVKKHKNAFTHAAVVRSMEEAIQRLKQENGAALVCSMRDIIELLSSKHHL
jgi:hypothetical protein